MSTFVFYAFPNCDLMNYRAGFRLYLGFQAVQNNTHTPLKHAWFNPSLAEFAGGLRAFTLEYPIATSWPDWQSVSLSSCIVCHLHSGFHCY